MIGPSKKGEHALVNSPQLALDELGLPIGVETDNLVENRPIGTEDVHGCEFLELPPSPLSAQGSLLVRSRQPIASPPS
jgi:hypothetical protein